MTGFETAGLVIYLACVGLLLFGGALVRDQWHWVILGYAILTWGVALVRRICDALIVRRELIAFRSLDAASREEFLRRLWPRGLRYEYERRVDLDEQPEVEGNTERFPFPAAERRLHWSLFGAATALAGVPSALVLIAPTLPAVLRVALLLVAVFAMIPATWLAGRLVLVSSRLEVTPFNVSLLWPAGRRVTVPFNQPLLLANHAAKGYFELRTPGGEASLRIHHARIASLRAVQLIYEYAGFEAGAASEQGAT